MPLHIADTEEAALGPGKSLGLSGVEAKASEELLAASPENGGPILGELGAGGRALPTTLPAEGKVQGSGARVMTTSARGAQSDVLGTGEREGADAGAESGSGQGTAVPPLSTGAEGAPTAPAAVGAAESLGATPQLSTGAPASGPGQAAEAVQGASGDAGEQNLGEGGGAVVQNGPPAEEGSVEARSAVINSGLEPTQALAAGEPPGGWDPGAAETQQAEEVQAPSEGAEPAAGIEASVATEEATESGRRIYGNGDTGKHVRWYDDHGLMLTAVKEFEAR